MVKYATLASSFFTRWQIYKRRNEKQSSNKISASVSTYGIDTTAVQHIREIVFSSSSFSGFHIIFRDPTSQSPLFMFRKLYMQSCQPSFRTTRYKQPCCTSLQASQLSSKACDPQAEARRRPVETVRRRPSWRSAAQPEPGFMEYDLLGTRESDSMGSQGVLI